MTPVTTTYDELPYVSHPISLTHPDCLAVLALLHGLKPPPVSRCRVLELGCAGGGNLIPMALHSPESTFVGVDLSRRQVAAGQALLGALGLANVELKPLSILEVDAGLGRFDYVVCHGVYSWVPPPVQDKILAICAEQLVPNGVAYVSYNTYPGWYVRRMVRDMLCWHVGPSGGPQLRVEQARALLDFLARSAVVRAQSVYASLLKGAAELFRQHRDSYLAHEYLADVNEPVYFLQFVERAAARRLRCFADADFAAMRAEAFAPAVGEEVRRLSPDRLRQEQYLDFLRNQAFRRTLLCRDDQAASAEPRPEALEHLQASSRAEPESAGPGPSLAAPGLFRSPDGTTRPVDDPLLRAALLALAEVWPESLPFETLRAAVLSRLGPGHAPGPATPVPFGLHRSLLNGYLAGLLELHVCPPSCVRAVSRRPVACPLARHQAACGAAVTNLRHEVVELNELDRQLVRHLDGSRDAPGLVEVLTELSVRGALRLFHEGAALTDAQRLREHLSSSLDGQLARLAGWSLLIG
jgi:SAM-dependent methyltransferase